MGIIIVSSVVVVSDRRGKAFVALSTSSTCMAKIELWPHALGALIGLARLGGLAGVVSAQGSRTWSERVQPTTDQPALLANLHNPSSPR